jgi:hypothetical protein
MFRTLYLSVEIVVFKLVKLRVSSDYRFAKK